MTAGFAHPGQCLYLLERVPYKRCMYIYHAMPTSGQPAQLTGLTITSAGAGMAGLPKIGDWTRSSASTSIPHQPRRVGLLRTGYHSQLRSHPSSAASQSPLLLLGISSSNMANSRIPLVRNRTRSDRSLKIQLPLCNLPARVSARDQ